MQKAILIGRLPDTAKTLSGDQGRTLSAPQRRKESGDS